MNGGGECMTIYVKNKGFLSYVVCLRGSVEWCGWKFVRGLCVGNRKNLRMIVYGFYASFLYGGCDEKKIVFEGHADVACAE